MRTRSTKTIKIAAIAVALATGLTLSGCSVIGDLFNSVTGGGEEGNVFDLKNGDCFQEPDSDAQDMVSSVDIVKCSVEHDNEAFAVMNMAATDFPGDEAIVDEGIDFCIPEFLDFIETDMDYDGSIDFGFFNPSPETWAEGDREILCYAYDTEGPVTGSLKGAGK